MNGDGLIARLDREIDALHRQLMRMDELERQAPAWCRHVYSAEADRLQDALWRRYTRRRLVNMRRDPPDA